ncbi:hypothetical protein [Amycolatopsis sp. lyj-112]|uniref:hypothetical protein n=1 Tax=Amycolatopsis sp. lyj-112 TaxID=2789288 RepID=UPI00397AAA6D
MKNRLLATTASVTLLAATFLATDASAASASTGGATADCGKSFESYDNLDGLIFLTGKGTGMTFPAIREFNVYPKSAVWAHGFAAQGAEATSKWKGSWKISGNVLTLTLTTDPAGKVISNQPIYTLKPTSCQGIKPTKMTGSAKWKNGGFQNVSVRLDES